MLRQFLRVLEVYREAFIWSFVFNVIILVLQPFGVLAIMVKLLLLLMLVRMLQPQHGHRQLRWIHQLKLLPLSAIAGLWLIDTLQTLLFFNLIKAYV